MNCPSLRDGYRSDCGAFVVQNLVSVIKANGQLSLQDGQQLRALHHGLLTQNSETPLPSVHNIL